MQLLFERTAIIVGGVASCVPPIDRLTIRGKADGRNRLPLAGEARQDLAGVDIPEQNGFVIATTTRHPLPAGMKGRGDDQMVVAGEGALHLTCRIGKERELARSWGRIIARQEPLSIGRKGQG